MCIRDSLDTKFADLDLSTGNGVQSRFEIILKEAIKNDLTLEEVYKKVAGSRGNHIFVGTPEQLADKMEEWFKSSAADGFNIMPPILPSQFEVFINNVIPILQERNLYKETYSEGTLRQKVGLENE